MEEAGLQLLLACTRHNVRYLTGGYSYHFLTRALRFGRSQSLPFVGLPRGRFDEAFYLGRVIETDFIHPEIGHVKIEDAVAVTESGCEGLGDRGRDWHVIPA
jgi:hypothetical protein